MKLLHVDSSILGAHSVSREVAAAAVARLRQEHPGLQVAYRDLAAAPLPHLNHLPGEPPASDADDRAASQQALDEFLAADIVVIGAPMYNFTISSQLKAWIDRILVSGKTFQYGADGVVGLAAGKRVIVAASRGGLYGPGAPGAAIEYAETYLRAVFGLIGIAAPEFIIAEGVQMSPDHRNKALEGALRLAANLRAA